MSLMISLPPETEARLRAEAAHAGFSVEDLAAQRLVEAELLWRIRTVAPETETKELHRLLRRREAGRLTVSEQVSLQMLLDIREQRSAERLKDIGYLAHLRSIPIPVLMNQLGISPISSQ